MAAWVFSWAFLVAALSQNIYCFTVKKDSHPSSSYGSGGVNSQPAAPASNQYSPGAFIPGVAPPKGVSKSGSYRPPPQRESSRNQPSVQRKPATSHSSGSFSGPAESGNRGSSSPSVQMPSGSTQPSAHYQPDFSQELPWAVAPSLFRVGEETNSGSSKMVPRPGNVRPPPPAPETGSEFQPGVLSHLESSFEHGDYLRETEEQGLQPPPPPPPPPPGIPVSAGHEGLTSQPQPTGSLNRFWSGYPYDLRFLTGQFPPGTVTHFSSSFEQGRDHWQDTHYERDHVPVSANVEQQSQTFPSDSAYPQSYQQPQSEVQSPLDAYGQGGAEEVGHTVDEEGSSVPYYGGYIQPGLYDQSSDVSSQTSGYNMGKISGY